MSRKPFEPTVRTEILDEGSVLKIHNAALEILDRTGMAVHTDQARKVLVDAGCKQSNDNVMHIPAKLVEKALETAPESITLYDRLGEPRCFLEGWKTSYGTGSDCPFILDRETRERRQCTYEDVGDGALVCDSLEHFDFVMPVGIVSDRPTDVADVYAVEASMKGTVKPIVFTAHNATTFQASVDMAAVVAGGLEKLQEKPIVCLYTEPISPLTLGPEATDKLILAGKLCIPVVFTPCPSMGATAPVTPAGLLAQGTAECLGGLVIHQIVSPGAPIIFGGVMTTLDMSTTIYPYGCPELVQMCSALTCMAHHYKLPMFGTAGCSDSKTVDAQDGMEIGFSILLATLAGQNLIHDIGFLDSALVTSYEAYVLSDEAIGMAKHIARGIDVTEETLALDVIDEVGQTGNHLQHDHTLKHFRNEFYFPKVVTRKNYSTWEKDGAKAIDVRLKEKVDHVLASHKPEPIDPAAATQMQEILTGIETKMK